MDPLSMVLYPLSWILTLMFLKAGLVKVTHHLFPKEHQLASERFVLCAKVCPSAILGYTPPPGGYMFVIGVIETLSAVLLLLPFPEFHKEVYLIFSLLMVLAIYTHGVLTQFDKMVVPTCIFLLSVVLYKAGHISPFANSILE